MCRWGRKSHGVGSHKVLTIQWWRQQAWETDEYLKEKVWTPLKIFPVWFFTQTPLIYIMFNESENDGIIFFFNPSIKLLPCLFKHQCMIKICIFSLRGRKCIIYNCVLKCWHKYFISLHMRWLTVPQQCRGCNATTGNPWALLVHVSHCGYSDKP